MRTTEEQLRLVLQKRDGALRARRKRKKMIGSVVASLASLTLVLTAILWWWPAVDMEMTANDAMSRPENNDADGTYQEESLTGDESDQKTAEDAGDSYYTGGERSDKAASAYAAMAETYLVKLGFVAGENGYALDVLSDGETVTLSQTSSTLTFHSGKRGDRRLWSFTAEPARSFEATLYLLRDDGTVYAAEEDLSVMVIASDAGGSLSFELPPDILLPKGGDLFLVLDLYAIQDGEGEEPVGAFYRWLRTES